MQKKIIVLAIAAALTAPAAFAADASNVTVYGKVAMDFETNNDSSAALGSVSSIANNASRFGVKGSEELGDNLKAIYQMEIQADVTKSGGAAAAGFGNGTRNSRIGLQGDFGTLFMGTWDTPFKVAHNKLELFDNTGKASAGNILGLVNKGYKLSDRFGSSVQYHSPKMSGFQIAANYAIPNAKTATANSSIIDVSATYENDMFYGAAAFSTTKDENLAKVFAAGNKSDGTRLVGAFKFDGGLVGLTYEQLTGKTAGVSAKRTAYELVGKYAVGSNNFGVSYTKAGNFGGVALTGANSLALRYGYKFSKRTEVFAQYATLKNDAAATYLTALAGGKNDNFGIGMVHSF